MINENITEKEIFDRFTKVNFYVDGIVDMMYQGDKKDEKAKEEYKKQIKDTIYRDTAKKLIFDMYSEILTKVVGFTGLPKDELDIRKADNKFNSQEIKDLDKTGKASLQALKNKVENASANPKGSYELMRKVPNVDGNSLANEAFHNMMQSSEAKMGSPSGTTM